ncbi:hypothetical protein T440DRAFT_464377 [Plenodomus tracheiphilus IPT5]|uniref:Uncharacterized protein n=1 Tax=Plenodomus tracheiphilus IPT5 TaxID=1408161 RepID=A0A6A7BI15_9PLEO|nr:hypothetical protein T440DRAFT_464377 [Plenodomus tracheiphilus IPT5]
MKTIRLSKRSPSAVLIHDGTLSNNCIQSSSSTYFLVTFRRDKFVSYHSTFPKPTTRQQALFYTAMWHLHAYTCLVGSVNMFGCNVVAVRILPGGGVMRVRIFLAGVLGFSQDCDRGTSRHIGFPLQPPRICFARPARDSFASNQGSWLHI